MTSAAVRQAVLGANSQLMWPSSHLALGGTFNFRQFSDESNFDGHSDFDSKSKVGGEGAELAE